MNTTKQKIILSWSGGKDSALALNRLLQSDKHEVAGLLTTVTEDYNRISIHGVRNELLERQAELVGLPIFKVMIPKICDNHEYERRMEACLKNLISKKITAVAFGDIFLEDLKKYREDKLSKVNLKAIFPLWLNDTKALVNEFIDEGFNAIISCVDTKKLPESFAGQHINQSFLDQLPNEVDPCGENGEFHSFVTKAPFFKDEIKVTVGEKKRVDQFCFRDIVPLEI